METVFNLKNENFQQVSGSVAFSIAGLADTKKHTIGLSRDHWQKYILIIKSRGGRWQHFRQTILSVTFPKKFAERRRISITKKRGNKVLAQIIHTLFFLPF